MKNLVAIAALFYSQMAIPEQLPPLEWWMRYEFGRCTATDIQERGICGDLEVRQMPRW